MRNFIIEHDCNKRDTGAIPQADTIYNLVLTGSVEKTFSVPSGANIAVFSTTGNFYCRFDATAAVPTIDVVDGTGSELNPVARVVTRVSVIHLIAPADCIVVVSFYNVPQPVA